MTNKEYIIQVLSQFGLSVKKVDIILLNSQLNADDNAEPLIVKEALYNNAGELLNGFDSVSEGGTSLSFNRDNFMLWYSLLCKELNKPNVINSLISSVTDISDSW